VNPLNSKPIYAINFSHNRASPQAKIKYILHDKYWTLARLENARPVHALDLVASSISRSATDNYYSLILFQVAMFYWTSIKSM